MCQKGRELDVTGGLVDRGGLDGGDLLLAQALADNIEAAGQGSIAEGSVPLAGELGPDGGAESFLRIGELRLRRWSR